MKKKLFHFLCNEYSGKLISGLFGNSIPNIRNGFKRYEVPEQYCNGTVKAMLFWGFYESAEMRLIRKHIVPDLPVVELGASLGVISCRAIGGLDIETDYTCIEANPFLIDSIKNNIKKHHPQKKKVVVENIAIAYTDQQNVAINISRNNTQGRINYESGTAREAIKVKASTLLPFSSKPYTLICDIEGMEIEIIKNDQLAFKNCMHLFIELHKAWYLKDVFEVDDLKNFIIDMGYTMVDRDGNVFYFNKMHPA